MMKIVVLVCSCVCAVSLGEPIDVVCDEFSAGQCEETNRVVQAVEALSSEYFVFDIDSYEDDAMLELHFQVQDYYNADNKLNGGRFKRNWAFANYGAMQAHVALQPPVPTEVLDAAGLPVQTKVQIAHEAVHLCIYRAFRNHGSHPGWLSEGLAEHMSNEAVRNAGYMGAIEDEPWTCSKINLVGKLFEDKPKYDIDSILSNESKDISGGRLYAVRGMFIGWLREIGAFDDMISEARRLGGGDSYEENLRRATLEAIASAGVENPDAAFKAWVATFEPNWDQRYRSLQTNGEVWLHGAFSSKNAVCWNSQELGDGNWEIAGSFKIFEGEKTQMNILLGRSDTGYLSIALGPKFGVTVFHRKYIDDGKKSRWIRLVDKDIKSIKLDEWSTFKVSQRKGRLMVRINKDRAIRVELGDIDVTGAWGLGVQNKSAGLWKDVQVEN